MARGKLTEPRRTPEEIARHLASLPDVHNDRCGHFAPASRELYAKGNAGLAGMCVECYREHFRAIQRGARKGTPLGPSYPAPTIDMGGVTVHSSPQSSTSGRKTHQGCWDLYDVVLYDEHDNNRVIRRKAGITSRGLKRYSDMCVLLGLSMKATRRAVTYKTKKAAERAETALVASIAADPGWTQVAKEAFAPVNKTMKVTK